MGHHGLSQVTILENLADTKTPKMGLDWRERSYLLVFFDVLALCVSLILSFWWTSRDVYELVVVKPYWFATFILSWFCVTTVMQSYDMKRCFGIRSVFETALAASIASMVYQWVPLPFITPTFPGRRLYILCLPIVSFTLIYIWRFTYARIFSQMMFKRRLLVVGAGRAGETLVAQLKTYDKDQAGDGSCFQVLGFVDDKPEMADKSVHGLSVLGSSRDLASLVAQLKPDEIVIAITNLEAISNELFQAVIHCRATGSVVTTMATVYERLTAKIPLRHVGRNLQVLLPLERDPIYRLYVLLKRVSDVFFAITGITIMLFLAPIIWILNRINSPGPLMFSQERVGLMGKHYTVYKFRTMNVDAEKHGAQWAGERDPRITRHGHFMRKTRIDELPQMVNVLFGEMTLIGPRPERPQFVAQLEKEIPFYSLRHAHKPGLSGWAQVNYPYGASVEDSFQKLQYDLYYIKHQGFLLDTQIILRTINVVLGLKGR